MNIFVTSRKCSGSTLEACFLENPCCNSRLIQGVFESAPRTIREYCLALGKKNVFVVSIHVNAAGNGTKWLNVTGWSVFMCSGQTESDRFAECLCESAIKNFPGRRIRTDMSYGDMNWEEGFYILRKSWCPAVLTENFFMDNHSDLEYLQSRAGKQAVVDTHVEGIIEYLESK